MTSSAREFIESIARVEAPKAIKLLVLRDADRLREAAEDIGPCGKHPQSFQRIREIFAQRHPIESLFFEQWLKEQCNFATQTKEGKESGDRQSD